MKRTLLVGLDNPQNGNPRAALFPTPEWSAGGRLHRMVADHVSRDYWPGEYVKDFFRINLYPTRRAPTGKGSIGQDNDAFSHVLVTAQSLKVGDVVLLGTRVRGAFERHYGVRMDFLESHVTDEPLIRWWSLPHPSGRNYWYNDPENRANAGKLLARLRA